MVLICNHEWYLRVHNNLRSFFHGVLPQWMSWVMSFKRVLLAEKLKPMYKDCYRCMAISAILFRST